MPLYLFSALAAAVTVAGISTVVWIAYLAGRVPRPQRRLIGGGLLMISCLTLAFRPMAWTVIDLAVLAGAAGAVIWFEKALQAPIAVAVFLTVASVLDVISVIAGPSRMLMEGLRSGSSYLLLYLALVAPVHGHPIPIVGISDLFVGGSAAAALIRLGLRPMAVMGAVTVSLLCALAFGIWLGPAPAIPFLAAAAWCLVVRDTRRLCPR